MAKIETGKQTRFNSTSYQMNTPDGTMYVFVMFDNAGKPVGIQLSLGKAGSAVAAWANALSRVCSLALDHGAHITEIIQELSLQTTDRARINRGNISIRSGPEGVAVALMRALEDMNNDHYPDREERAPRMGIRRVVGER